MDFLLDFFIGLTVVNAMPHYVLGIWKGRMLGGLGFGNWQNVIYGIINLIVSVSLYLYKYGLDSMLENGIYLGAVFMVVIFMITAPLWYRIWHKGYYKGK